MACGHSLRRSHRLGDGTVQSARLEGHDSFCQQGQSGEVKSEGSTSILSLAGVSVLIGKPAEQGAGSSQMGTVRVCSVVLAWVQKAANRASSVSNCCQRLRAPSIWSTRPRVSSC